MTQKKLGEYGALSFSERHKIYVEHACERPCSDEIAGGMLRVQWLKEEVAFEHAPKSVLEIGMHDGGITRWMAHEMEDGDILPGVVEGCAP